MDSALLDSQLSTRLTPAGISRRAFGWLLLAGGSGIACAGRLAALWERSPPAASLTASTWRPVALTPQQTLLVETLAEHVLPRTETPGASDAGVHRFIDAVVAEMSPPDAERFRQGLALVDERLRERTGHDFVSAPRSAQVELLRELSQHLAASPTPLRLQYVPGVGRCQVLELPPSLPAAERALVELFRTVRSLTLVGYYTSELGRQAYAGVAPVLEVGP